MPAELHSLGTRPLTPEEDEQQRVRGLHFAALLDEVTADMVRATERHAILLSGGVDSTTTLVAMIRAGARPICLTMATPRYQTTKEGAPLLDGDGQRVLKLSSDARKAQRLAAHYGLEFHTVMLPEEPEFVAARIEEILEADDEIHINKPTLEVLFVMDRLMSAARDLGADAIFSGMGDSAIHLLGRENEIQGRRGIFLTPEADARRIGNVNDPQIPALTKLAHGLGVQLCLPITMTTRMFPYQGVPWHVMNFPRKKAITIRPYEADFEAAGVLVAAQPMQTGDSGSKEYFEAMIGGSARAAALTGLAAPTPRTYYNALSRKHQGGNPAGMSHKHDAWETWRANVEGVAPSAKFTPHWEVVGGRAALPPEIDSAGLDGDGEVGLFAEAGDPLEEYTLDPATGLPDTRVDCWGVPFYEGPGWAQSACARAQAGLCGVYRPEAPVNITLCEHFSFWGRITGRESTEIADVYGDRPVAAVYRAWGERQQANALRMADEAAAAVAARASKMP